MALLTSSTTIYCVWASLYVLLLLLWLITAVKTLKYKVVENLPLGYGRIDRQR